jgi:hypothetical protein
LGFDAAATPISRKAMLALRRRANTKGARYHGKHIFSYREWKNGGAWVKDDSPSGIWRAELLLTWRDPLLTPGAILESVYFVEKRS